MEPGAAHQHAGRDPRGCKFCYGVLGLALESSVDEFGASKGARVFGTAASSVRLTASQRLAAARLDFIDVGDEYPLLCGIEPVKCQWTNRPLVAICIALATIAQVFPPQVILCVVSLQMPENLMSRNTIKNVEKNKERIDYCVTTFSYISNR